MRLVERTRLGSALRLALVCTLIASACSESPAPQERSAAKPDTKDESRVATKPAAEPPAPAQEGQSNEATRASLPNIVLVSIDTLRSDRTSAYGYQKETTPTLAAMAAQGARVDKAFAHTGTTAPSHATLFTSLYPIAHGVPKNGVQLADEHPRLTEVLAASGYGTAAFVSTYVLNGRFGLSEGFTEYDDKFTPDRTAETACGKSKLERCADQTIDRAVEWLDKRRDSGPFFLFVHLFDPHAGYNPPAGFAQRFQDPEPQPSPQEAVEGTEEKAKGKAAKTPPLGRIARLVSMMKKGSSRYDGEIAFADQELARLLEALEKKGIASNTIVVVTADHGESLGQHGAITHGVNLYDEGLRIPMVFRWPGKIPAGSIVEGPVGLVDVMPTILELAGIPQGSLALQGHSVAPSILGKEKIDVERPVYLQRRSFESEQVGGVKVKGEAFGIRVGRWKYIESDASGRELFDLEVDPREKKNLITEQPQRAQALADQLQAWKLASQKGTGGKGAKVSDDDQKRLRALGYVD